MLETLTTAHVSIAQADRPNALVVRPIRWGFRALISVHALDAFAQAVLAGGFLNGSYDMLGLHRDNAIMGVVVLGYLQIVVAALYWRPAGGTLWPALASVGIAAAESLQIVLGFNRVVGLHVPLGVAIIAAMTVLTAWAWRGSFGLRGSFRLHSSSRGGPS